jgi:hypothetical protein
MPFTRSFFVLFRGDLALIEGNVTRATQNARGMAGPKKRYRFDFCTLLVVRRYAAVHELAIG